MTDVSTSRFLDETGERRAEAILEEGFIRRNWHASGLLLIADRLIDLQASLDSIGSRLAQIEEGLSEYRH